jgi:hypothetical protein
MFKLTKQDLESGTNKPGESMVTNEYLLNYFLTSKKTDGRANIVKACASLSQFSPNLTYIKVLPIESSKKVIVKSLL